MNQKLFARASVTIGEALADLIEWGESSVRRILRIERTPTVIWVRQRNNTYVGVIAEDGRSAVSRRSSASGRSKPAGS